MRHRYGLQLLAVVVLAMLTTSIGFAADALDLHAQSDQKIAFQGWQFATDVVQDTVKRYNREMGGHVEYSTIAGDYSSIMEKKFVAGDAPDILYGHVYDAVRYYEGGWIQPINVLPNYKDIAADLYPQIAKAWTYDGKVLGLPYFTSVINMVAVNLDKLSKAGLSQKDYPKTWDELYDQLYTLRAKGVEHAFLPAWYSEQWGIGWSFLSEVLNRGGMPADPVTHEPKLTADGPGGETLRDWKRIWNDGIVDREILSYREADHLEAWESGRYLYGSYMAYNISRSNDPKFSKIAGHTGFLPYQGQPWGILDVGLYLISKKPRTPQQEHDVQAFFSWYGFKDQNGKAHVAERWLNDFMLFSAYKSVMNGPTARKAMAASLADPKDVDKLLELYETTQYPAGVFNVVWSPEFQMFLKETLQDFLLKDKAVKDTIDSINAKIVALNKEYGIK